MSSLIFACFASKAFCRCSARKWSSGSDSSNGHSWTAALQKHFTLFSFHLSAAKNSRQLKFEMQLSLTESFWSIRFCLLVAALSIRTSLENWCQSIECKCFAVHQPSLESAVFAARPRRPWCLAQRMCTFVIVLVKTTDNQWAQPRWRASQRTTWREALRAKPNPRI